MNKKKMLSYILINIAVILFASGSYLLISQLRGSPVLKREPVKKEQPLKKEPISIAQEEVQASGKISITSSTSTYSVGEPFNLQIIIEADNQVIDGAEFELQYDPSLIRIDNISQGTFFTLYPKKEINENTGKIKLIALQEAGSNRPVSSVVLAAIQATALNKGSASFEFIENQTHLAGYGGQELLKKIENLTIIIE